MFSHVGWTNMYLVWALMKSSVIVSTTEWLRKNHWTILWFLTPYAMLFFMLLSCLLIYILETMALLSDSIKGNPSLCTLRGKCLLPFSRTFHFTAKTLGGLECAKKKWNVSWSPPWRIPLMSPTTRCHIQGGKTTKPSRREQIKAHQYYQKYV